MSSDKVPAPFPNPNNTSSKKRRWVEDSPSQFSNNAAPSQPKPKSESSMASVMSGANSKSSKKYKDDGEMSGGDQWGKKSDQPPSKKDSGPKELANFGVSGALAKDESTGNIYNGVQLKFSEPADARTPSTKWRLYVFKEGGGDDPIQTLHISKQSAYLFGREKRVADILVEHSSLSKQHCVLQYRATVDKKDGKTKCKPYLMDLGSTNGTILNGVKIDDARYYEMREQDVIKLGESTREYVLLADRT